MIEKRYKFDIIVITHRPVPAGTAFRLMKKIITTTDLREALLGDAAIFSRKDISVLPAASSEDILRLHRGEKADLIIAALGLREMAGDKLCETIRADKLLRKVSLIIISSPDPVDMARCRSCGANAVIPLPVDPALLLSRITELVQVAERDGLREIVRVDVQGNTDGHYFFSVSCNVSSSGMLLETGKALLPGDRLQCSFVLDRPVTVDAEVVRVVPVSSSLRRYGVRFVDPGPRATRLIEEFIKNNRQRR